MAILIKGIEMPEACGDCPFFGTGYGGTWWCFAIDEHVHSYDGRRDEHCPLTEIPDVYIDISKAFMQELVDKIYTKVNEV